MEKPKSFYDPEHSFSGAYSKNVFQTLRMAYKPFKKRILFFIFLGLVGRALLLANTNVIGKWVDSLQNNISTYSSQDYLWLLLAMSTSGFLLTMIYRIGFSRLSALAVSQIYDETTYRSSRFPMSFFDSTPAGRIITRFSSDYGNVFRLFGGPLAEFGAIVFDLFSMIILISIASPYYLPIVAFMTVVNYLVYRLNQNSLRNARRELSRSRSPSIAHFSETTQGASTIRSFIKQNSFTERFKSLDSYYQNQKLKTVALIMGFSFQMNFLTAILLLMTGFAAYFLYSYQLVTIGSIGVAFSFVVLSGNTVQMFFEWITQLEEAMVGVERMDQYLRKPIEIGSKLPARTQFTTGHAKRDSDLLATPLPKNASVQFENLSFRYREDLPLVLKDLSFEIKAGERLGVIGRTGSGKSSLVQALFYLYPLQSGQISINGQRPQLSETDAGMDLEIYRRHLSFITQEPVLFRGSLKHNLDIDDQLSDEKLFSVLNQVGLPYLAHKAGLAMEIEEKARNLSLGERQLLCMARCLLQQSPIVVMDEATSSVDPQSEEILVKATNDFFEGRTQIIIAHRLTTLQRCDRILWLHRGEIKMIGRPEEVLPVFEQTNLGL